MPSSLIRGKYVISKVIDRNRVEVINDGAVFQRDGVIVDIGRYQDLADKHTPDQILGSDQHVVLPGFVNSHHHQGLLSFQLGSPDLPLELWTTSRMGKRNVDPYLDTLYGAFEMIESGITTVQHLHLRYDGPVERIYDAAQRVLRAYEDIGMRVSYSLGVRDQNRLVYGADDDFLRGLPSDIMQDARNVLAAQNVPVSGYFSLFEQLHSEFSDATRIRIQLAPLNLQWCSDPTLEKFKEYSDRYQAPLHMHLLETKYQREYARRRCQGTAIDHLQRLGLLGPRLTLGHGVWLSESDIELIGETGTHVCHSPSSNLRLRSGIAPLNRLEKCGVCVAIGLDDASLNDDKSMLQEMRVALRLHRPPGMDDDVPTAAQILRMATEYGARTTPFGSSIGTLEKGKAADIVIMNWNHLSYPYLDPDVPIVDALVHRARTHGVETVVVGGEPVMQHGQFTRISKSDAVEELAASLRVEPSPEEKRRSDFARKLLPHVRRFYEKEGYLSPGR